jgi:predicted aconitase with swiveling domain
MDLAIATFVATCRLLGLNSAEIYASYVGGLDPEGGKISTFEHQGRGRALGVLQDKWLSSWGATSR